MSFRIPGSIGRRGQLALQDSIPLPRGYLSGMGFAQAADTDHDITVAVGEARDSANGTNIVLDSALTKQIDATWASGTNAGGLSSSLTAPAADTWYHVHAIIVAGAVDVGFDTSVTAANLVADHSATAYRRIGSVLTDVSSNIIAFTAREMAGGGLEFLWNAEQSDHTADTISTTAVLRAMSTPLGIQTLWHGIISQDAGGGQVLLVTSPDQTDVAASDVNAQIFQDGVNNVARAELRKRTNTSSQIRARASGSTTWNLITIGWQDERTP